LVPAHVPQFRQVLAEAAREQLGWPPPARVHEVDAVVRLGTLDWAMGDLLDLFEPCGQGNLSPVFCAHGLEVRSRRPFGESGLRLLLSDGSVRRQAIVNDANGSSPQEGDVLDVVFQFQRHEWNGMYELQLVLTDWRPAAQR